MQNFTKTLAFFEDEIGEINGQSVAIHFTTPKGGIIKMDTKVNNIIEGQIFVRDYNSAINISDLLILELSNIIYFHKRDYYSMLVLKSAFEKVLMVSQIDLMSSPEPQTFTGFQLESSLQYLYERSGMKMEDGSSAFERLVQTPYHYLCPVNFDDGVYAIGNETVIKPQSHPLKEYRVGNKAMWLFAMVDSVNSNIAIRNN